MPGWTPSYGYLLLAIVLNPSHNGLLKSASSLPTASTARWGTFATALGLGGLNAFFFSLSLARLAPGLGALR